MQKIIHQNIPLLRCKYILSNRFKLLPSIMFSFSTKNHHAGLLKSKLNGKNITNKIPIYLMKNRLYKHSNNKGTIKPHKKILIHIFFTLLLKTINNIKSK